MIVAKSCDQCGGDSIKVDTTDELKTGDSCHCPECGITGTIVFHGATPSSDAIEYLFDIQFDDPETGGDYRV